ncbi:MAG: hypothetical protein ACRDI2_04205, partial [Chloroflexota bacterium]
MIIGPGRRHRPPAEAAETQERVRQALERELARVDSPEVAEAIAQRLDRLAAGTTEQQRGAEAAHSPASAAGAVEGATHIGSPADEAAAVLVKAAEEAVAPTPEEAV